MTHHHPRGLAAAVLLGLLLSLAACGSSSKSSSTTAAASSESTSAGTGTTSSSGGSASPGTASAEVCAAREDLQTSITDLKNVDIVASGTSGVQAAITKINDNLSTLRSAAGDELQPQVGAFQDALSGLETAVKNISSGGVAAVVTAATDVGTTGGDLLTALQGLKCS